MSRPLVLLAAIGSLVAAAVVTPSPALAAEQTVLSRGHVDVIDVHYEGGALSLKVRDDTGASPVTRDPADVLFHALPESQTTVPDVPSYAFLGAPGTPVWLLPQVQDPNLLWPGWETLNLPTGVFAGGKIRLSLVGVEGPGRVSVFVNDPFGNAQVLFRSDDGLPDAIEVGDHVHAHANWAFSATGRYTLKFQADGTLTDGTAVSSGAVDYTFAVGELTDPDPEVALDIFGMQDSYAPGQQVNLVALQTPETELDHYHWFSKCAGAADFAVVPGEGGAAYSFTATEALDGCQYKAVLYDEDHNAVAEAAPVTLVVEDGGGPGEPGGSQSIVATVRESDGALVLSVDPNDRTVALPATTLGAAGDRLEAAGALRPVTVTDTRAAKPGWNASGQVSAFTADGGANFGGKYLGWTPQILAQASGQGVVAGPIAPPGFTSGNGIAGGAVLGSAPAGSGRGTARLGAELRLELPTDTGAGTYTATLTLTAI
ncbi:choice-of-anchor M domain-containing protein [Phytohabitans sp. LJ34]|uniref:choice-of-anchor M domain-containing protein n=1 Tax=Phytohabitans sp. LJ34 TaxID=3452217 RepID=UPI003F8A4961